MESPDSESWETVPADDMWRFFALVILMGLSRKPRLSNYWSRKPIYNNPIFSKTLSRDRFQRILGRLHFVNNAEQANDPNNRLFKLGTVYKNNTNRFKAVYTPMTNISIDETLSKWRGRVSFRQYIPSKAAKYGIKAFVLAEAATGYVYCHHIYTGNEKEAAAAAGMSITENIVMCLMVSLLHLGYKLWMDNWYNSPGLAKRLLAARTHVWGTLRSNRKAVPKLVQKHPNNTKLKKGESVTYSSDKIMVGTWQDKKPITMLSTMHQNCSPVPTGNTTRDGQPILKPTCIQDYNRYVPFIIIIDRVTNSLELKNPINLLTL